MNSVGGEKTTEIERIRRVVDMMVTCHAHMKEHYFSLSLISDVFLFSCTVLLCIIAFADQNLLIRVFGANFNMYVGVFSVLTFIYSFLSTNLDWKVKAEKHKVAFEKYVDLKRECNDLLDQVNKGEQVDCSRFIEKYYTITAAISSIPERLFLKCKRHHKLKVAISRHLDQNPGTSIFLFRLKLWVADNFGKSK